MKRKTTRYSVEPEMPSSSKIMMEVRGGSMVLRVSTRRNNVTVLLRVASMICGASNKNPAPDVESQQIRLQQRSVCLPKEALEVQVCHCRYLGRCFAASNMGKSSNDHITQAVEPPECPLVTNPSNCPCLPASEPPLLRFATVPNAVVGVGSASSRLQGYWLADEHVLHPTLPQ